MSFVEIEDIEPLLPRPLDLTEHDRAEALIVAAENRIREEMGRVGRDLDSEYECREYFDLTVDRVIREMVATAIGRGSTAGMTSVSSSTGTESDSATFADGGGVWGSVWLSDAHRRDLGLGGGNKPSGGFPLPWLYPEVMHW